MSGARDTTTTTAAPAGWISYPLQALCYAAFVAFVGYFSTSPSYVHLPAGEALVKLSFQHAGQRKVPCRERTPEELAKLAPNMRAAQDCRRSVAWMNETRTSASPGSTTEKRGSVEK